MKRTSRFGWLSILVVAMSYGGALVAATLINGAGASFPYPLYAKWFASYGASHPGVNINYQSIGSGGGIRQFLDHTIDFGASDAPMTDEQLAKAGAPVLHIPTALGAVVVTYQLPGITDTLKLSPEVLSDIFLGKITRWSDARLVKLNPNAKLPDQAILVTHRSDGSGTTYIFTDYLSKVSAEWKGKIGAGTAVRWPVGLGGKGNEGVAGLVKQTPGSIGYVELIYAAHNQLPSASLQNRAGKFTSATLESVTAAAASLPAWPQDYRVSLTDAPGATAYPISGLTYLLVWKKMPDANKGQKLVRFLSWAIGDGQKLNSGLQYAPLPASVTKRLQSTIAQIEIPKPPASR